MTPSFASDYLARSLYLKSEEDLRFLFEAARLVEPILTNSVLAIVPCHVNDAKAGIKTCQMIRSQNVNVCIFLNCLDHESSDEEFQQKIEECHFDIENAGCRIGSDTALIARRHGTVTRMGKVRGCIADACLIALMNKGSNSAFVFLDADTLLISDTYFRAIHDSFAGQYRPMMAVGAVHYGYRPDGVSCLPDNIGVPELLLADRVNQAILQCARNGQINYERRVWAEGASFAFDPIAYCKVGGFDWNLASGEDDAFGRAMHRYNPKAMAFPLRDVERVFETCPENVRFLREAWLVTDPRRHLKAISEGGGGTEAWNYVPFDQQPGHELSLQSLLNQYGAAKDRIANSLFDKCETRQSPLELWARIRVVKLVTSMLRADRRIRNQIQANSVWAQLGFAAGAPSGDLDHEQLAICDALLRQV